MNKRIEVFVWKKAQQVFLCSHDYLSLLLLYIIWLRKIRQYCGRRGLIFATQLSKHFTRSIYGYLYIEICRTRVLFFLLFSVLVLGLEFWVVLGLEFWEFFEYLVMGVRGFWGKNCERKFPANICKKKKKCKLSELRTGVLLMDPDN